MTAAGCDPGPDADAGAAPGADPGVIPDRNLTRLLRWYPRAWRERYGDEFLAMVEDTLEGRRPGWRLHLEVIRAGLRERVRRAVPAVLRSVAKDAAQPVSLYGFGISALSSLIYFWSLQSLAWIPLSAGGYRGVKGTVAADTVVGLCIVIGIAVIGGGLAAVPALVRFLRAGGWPGIRRQVAQAAVTTVVAAGTLTGLLLMVRSMTYGQLTSNSYAAWSVATLLLLEGALLLWRRAAVTTARRLDLPPRVRAVQAVLGAVATAALLAVTPVQLIWTAQAQHRSWLLGLGVVLLVFFTRTVPFRLRRAWRLAGELRRG